MTPLITISNAWGDSSDYVFGDNTKHYLGCIL